MPKHKRKSSKGTGNKRYMPQEIRMTNEELAAAYRALQSPRKYEIDVIALLVLRELLEVIKPQVSILGGTERDLMNQYAAKDEKGVVIVQGYHDYEPIPAIDPDKGEQYQAARGKLMKDICVFEIKRKLRVSWFPLQGLPILGALIMDTGPLLDVDVDLDKLLKDKDGAAEK